MFDLWSLISRLIIPLVEDSWKLNLSSYCTSFSCFVRHYKHDSYYWAVLLFMFFLMIVINTAQYIFILGLFRWKFSYPITWLIWVGFNHNLYNPLNRWRHDQWLIISSSFTWEMMVNSSADFHSYWASMIVKKIWRCGCFMFKRSICKQLSFDAQDYYTFYDMLLVIFIKIKLDFCHHGCQGFIFTILWREWCYDVAFNNFYIK